MTVHWTDNAIADLQAIRTTIARHSDRYALGMVKRIFERVVILEDQPRIGQMVPEFENDDIRELFEHPYRIIYRILPSRIDVLTVVHGSRQLRRSLIEPA